MESVCLKRKQMNRPMFVFENPEISVNKAIHFMKKMTVATISQITLLREVFPKSDFEMRRWEGNKLPILKSTSSASRKVIDWIKNALKILELHYLKKLFLVIKKENSEAIIEIYTFCFTYKMDEIKCHIQSTTHEYEMEINNTNEELPQDMKTNILNLLLNTKCHIDTLLPLPERIVMKINLELNDNVPEDFVLPKLFRPVDSIDLTVPGDVRTLKLGRVESKFVKFGLSTKSTLLSSMKNIEESHTVPYNRDGEIEAVLAREANLSQSYNSDNVMQQLKSMYMGIESSPKTPANTVGNCDLYKDLTTPTPCGNLTQQLKSMYEGIESSPKTPENTGRIHDPNKYLTTPPIPECVKENSEGSKLSETMSSVHLRDKQLKCICELEDDILETIQCARCSNWQHKACYKLLDHESAKRHICVSCHDPTCEKRTCTNIELLKEQGKEEAMYRRALSLCESNNRVSVNTFVSHLNISRKEAMRIFHRLKGDGCFLPEAKERSIRTVHLEHLKENVFNVHFNTVANQLASMDTEEYIPSSTSITQARNSNNGKRKCNKERDTNQKHFKFAVSDK